MDGAVTLHLWLMSVILTFIEDGKLVRYKGNVYQHDMKTNRLVLIDGFVLGPHNRWRKTNCPTLFNLDSPTFVSAQVLDMTRYLEEIKLQQMAYKERNR